MCARPVREIERLHADSVVLRDQPMGDGRAALGGRPGEAFHVVADIEVGDAKTIAWEALGLGVNWDAETGALTCKDQSAPLRPRDGRLRFEVIADRLSVEVFGNDGEAYMPMAHASEPGADGFSLRAEGGGATARTLEVHRLRSGWGR